MSGAPPQVGLLPGAGWVCWDGRQLVFVDAPLAVASELLSRLGQASAAATVAERVRAIAVAAIELGGGSGVGVVAVEGAQAVAYLFGPIDLVTSRERVSAAEEMLGVTRTVEWAAGLAVVSSAAAAPPLSPAGFLLGGLVPGGGVVLGPSDDSTQLLPAVDAAAESSEGSPAAESDLAVGAQDRAGAEARSPHDLPATVAAPRRSGGVPPPPSVPQPDPATLGGEPAAEWISLEAQPGAIRSPLPIEAERSPGAPGPEPAEESRPRYEEPVEVLGRYSPAGFFNHPDARYCSRTGQKIGASQTAALARGPRPALGVLTFDDGSTYSVQWTTVLGREPWLHEDVVNEAAAPLAIGDEAKTVSRTHLRVELVDWDVYVVDLGAGNGTHLTEPGGEERRLVPHERALLSSGTKVRLGRRSFVYHAHHVR